MHLTELELAAQIKSVLIEGVKTKWVDRGPKSWLERFIYVANLRNMMFIIGNHGFFPDQEEHMEQYAPELYKMCQYTGLKNKALRTDFQKIYDSIVMSTVFSSTFTRAAPAKAFDPTRHTLSILPIFTMVFIHHLKTTAPDSMKSHPILRRGQYIGAKKTNPSAPLDNLCFMHKKVVDGVNSDIPQAVRKLRDTSLINSGSPVQVFKRDQMAFAMLKWMNRTGLNGDEHTGLRKSKKYWDDTYRNTRPIMNTDKGNLKSPPETLVEAETTVSPKRKSKSAIDKTKMREDFQKLSTHLTSLEKKLPSTSTDGREMHGIFKLLCSTVLTLATTTDLGSFASLEDLTNSLGTPVLLPTALGISGNNEDDTQCDQPLDKQGILNLLTGHGYGPNSANISFLKLNTEEVGMSTFWKEKLHFMKEDNCILMKLHAPQVVSVQNVYAAYQKANKKKLATTDKALAEAIRKCINRGWSSSVETKGKQDKKWNIIVLAESSANLSAMEKILVEKQNKKEADDNETSDEEVDLLTPTHPNV